MFRTTFWRPLWSIYWTDERQHGIYLFYTIKNTQLQLFISKSFSNTRKPAFAHFGKHEKKSFDVICCLYKMKQSHWLLCRNKELWLVKKNHATVKLDSNSSSWKQRKQNWTAKSTSVKENAGKINSFCHQSSLVGLVGRKAWMFPWILLKLEEYARKTYGCGQHWTPFDSSF